MNQLQKGANSERSDWMNKVRRMLKSIEHNVWNGNGRDILLKLLEFGHKRERRTRKRKGGI